MAAASSYATGLKAKTYNAAGVSQATLDNNNLGVTKGIGYNITAIFMNTDPLNIAQSMTFIQGGSIYAFPKVDGHNKISIKATNHESNVNGHSIDNLVNEILKIYPK